MPIPYIPDDEHFYQSVGQGGDYIRNYQDMMSEENANSTLAQGQMGANAISQLPGNIMKGAQFSTQQNAAAQQAAAMDQAQRLRDAQEERAQSEEQRTQAKFGPEMTQANLQSNQMGADYNFQNGPASDAETMAAHMPRGTSRREVAAALGNKQTSVGIAGTQMGTNQGAFSLSQAKRDQALQDFLASGGQGAGGGAMPTSAPSGSMPSGAQLISIPPQGAVGYQGGQVQMAPGQQGAQPPSQAPGMSEEAINRKAKEIGIAPEALKGYLRQNQAKIAVGQRQAALTESTVKDSSSEWGPVRQKAREFKGKIDTLDNALQRVGNWDRAKGEVYGVGDWIASKAPGGMLTSAQQNIIADVRDSMKSMGLEDEAAKLDSVKMRLDPKSTMNDVIRTAVTKINQQLNATAQGDIHSSDPEVQNTLARMKQFIAKYGQGANGGSGINLMGNQNGQLGQSAFRGQ